MFPKALLLLSSLVMLAGCWNGENVHIRMGDVSVGQQLIDLKAAFDADALTEAEYQDTKATLLALNSLCASSEPDD